MSITGFCTGQGVLDDRKMDCMRIVHGDEVLEERQGRG